MGSNSTILLSKMAKHDDHDFAASIITFHEQAIGAHKAIQNARNEVQLRLGYNLMQRAFIDYQRFTVVAFEEREQAVFHNFPGNLRVNVMDLRIAAIAIANNLTLLSRNLRDFARVPGLRVEDWTVENH